MVGRGGYVEVYRGMLDGEHVIAVKRLAKGAVDMHKEREFLAELGILGHVCHPHTAYLIGCCIKSGLHLIFDFSPNGTLASALHGRSSKLLGWSVRYKIAIWIARGLHSLQKCFRRQIIRRNIKAPYIHLGEDFVPQAKQLIQSGNMAELADPKLEENYDVDQMEKVGLTASYCIRCCRSSRRGATPE